MSELLEAPRPLSRESNEHSPIRKQSRPDDLQTTGASARSCSHTRCELPWERFSLIRQLLPVRYLRVRAWIGTVFQEYRLGREPQDYGNWNYAL